MPVKLHRCSATWAKVGAHPCYRVQVALDEAGVEYEVALEGYGYPRSRRRATIERTGQRQFPWIEFDDGSVYRAESKEMAAEILAGRLLEHRGSTVSGAAPETPETA